ncbi:hypothetical protein LOTGIDRAFT_195007 [Lottia gigantea]|uniref:Exosome complex component CSL4 n=1 Tax=Lottia gigantea TaxID=225164 RepID=V3ZVE0_LOTGI|nr:hypothetical protein LOTGIDRAFT_195007 [Lottia gigantea]ESO86560.1 hypothetical protein LOTGIDRAFT_195007 [Lottia gigantea]
MATSTICVPGQRILRTDDDHISGNGTYTRNGYIYSTLVGYVFTQTNDDGKTIVEVRSSKTQNVVPSEDDIVTARVTNVNARFCKCSILSIGKTKLQEPFRGTLRKEDVRATEKDKVEMYKCFRPGDIIAAQVLSLGDAQSYLLSTSENELGVVIATSETGGTMVPISWCKMQCTKTLSEEFRKVAKVQPQFIEYSS